ncbi:hypothetical protein [Variovorax sp. DXTD-1]|uniref:hypothetical protein n=1 Tax=Variovorax sp. DXTD-1 TaxID=2495592 RepID=UPI000F866603|nr:hypothetical protein [Variovorax sp. DXTD-1]RST46349.1 hypothetical protein EJI00_21715 [Variovorax sp. DXTD-1]
MTSLHYLDFDYSEDTEGHGTFDAMATTVPAKTREVLAEIAEVLAWANAAFPDMQGALENGAAWDFDLQQTREAPDLDTVTFSLSGTADFCAALREQFKLD